MTLNMYAHLQINSMKHKTRKAIRQEKHLLNVSLSDKQARGVEEVMSRKRDYYILKNRFIIHHGPTMPADLVELGVAFFEEHKEYYMFVCCQGLYHPLSDMHICPTANNLIASLYQKPKGFRLVVIEDK